MSGYRRFVAYVYEYQKGKKGSNCGFIKVEVREQRCTMEVHLHCVGLTPQVECNVYGFVRKDGLMDGVLLGSCETGEDTAECLIETDSLNMGGSGISLGRMGGMVLVTESGGFFGTEWDDQPIRPDNFREIQGPEQQLLQKPRSEKKKQNISNETGILSDEDSLDKLEAGPNAKVKSNVEATPHIESESDMETAFNVETVPHMETEANMEIEEEVPVKSDKEEIGEADVPADINAEMEKGTTQAVDSSTDFGQVQKNAQGFELLDGEATADSEENGSGQSPESNIWEKHDEDDDETVDRKTQRMMEEESEERNMVEQEFKALDSEIISQSMNDLEEESSILKNIQMVAENEALLKKTSNARIICPPNSNCGPGPRPPRPPKPGPGPRPPMPPKPGPGPRPPMPPKPGPGPRPPMPPKPGFRSRPPVQPRGMVKASIGEEIMPFGDGEVTQCWKIHPKDFACFQQRECALRNNRFLLHGYYNFGHLLLGQKANGQYILGVPGGYDQQERYMANMFGFPYFKESSQIELPKGRGGYWYRLINAPNFH